VRELALGPSGNPLQEKWCPIQPFGNNKLIVSCLNYPSYLTFPPSHILSLDFHAIQPLANLHCVVAGAAE